MAQSRSIAVVGLSFLWLMGSWSVGQAHKTKSFKFKQVQVNLITLTCPKDERLHIERATWSARSAGCTKVESRLTEVQGRCENKAECRFRPHWSSNQGDYLSLGDLCFGIKEWMDGDGSCWKPCHNVDCGAGTCNPVTYNTYECQCNPNANNKGGDKKAACVVDPCYGNPCKNGKCMKSADKGGYKCFCVPNHRFVDGTCKPYDTCTDTDPPRCPAGATCSDGFGKEPTCVCKENYEMKDKKCVIVDRCLENNGDCPSDAKCTDGVRKEPTCVCPENHELKDKKCVAVDRCLKNNGDCPSDAKCTDGVGKKPTCVCPENHELKDNKCVIVDRCLVKNGGCDAMATCSNGTAAKPTCTCPEHYKVAEDGKKCVDINECETNNGGCDPNATCHNHVGKPSTCECNEGYVEKDNKCVRPGSFTFPASGVVKVTLFEIQSDLILSLVNCMTVNLNITSGEVKVTHDKQEQKGTLPVQNIQGAFLLLLLHRNKDIMETVVYVQDKNGKKPQGPLYVNVKWDGKCRSDAVRAEGDFSKGREPKFYRTLNMLSDMPAS